jgi:hypothetical protein
MLQATTRLGRTRKPRVPLSPQAIEAIEADSNMRLAEWRKRYVADIGVGTYYEALRGLPIAVEMADKIEAAVLRSRSQE